MKGTGDVKRKTISFYFSELSRDRKIARYVDYMSV
jgi:hypothetical protein